MAAMHKPRYRSIDRGRKYLHWDFTPPIPAAITTVVVQDDKKMAQLLQSPPKSLHTFIALQEPGHDVVQRANKLGIYIRRFEEVEAMGAASKVKEKVSPCL